MKSKPKATEPAAPEPKNVRVQVLQNRTQIGKAICAAGPCDVRLTLSDAKALEALGLVRVLGIF